MTTQKTDTLVVGGGQAGLAMSAHLTGAGVPHLVLERDRIAERWRTGRWESLVANGPAWHDRFPPKEFDDVPPDGFAPKDSVARYLEDFAQQIGAPVRCGVEVTRVVPRPAGGYRAETSDGIIEAERVVAATGPFQVPVRPSLVPDDAGPVQIHSADYRNPAGLPPGAVLVVGAGSSGAQIADELLRDGREVWLSVGPHDRPPRAYRGHDYCWWLGVLGKWEAPAPPEGKEHVTISVSGAHGGETVEFRKLADRGMRLVGRAEAYADGALRFRGDLADNIRAGDENLLSVLTEADAYAEAHGLDLPPEPQAHDLGPLPRDALEPVLSLDLAAAGITSIVWATGYTQDFGWLQADTFDPSGAPLHDRGVGAAEGIYFLGLPWLSMRGSSFIWGVWVDAERLAGHIAAARAAG